MLVFTLGGAYAALGDYDPVAAKRAECMALRQAWVASLLGDHYLVARCRLFVAFSALQQGGCR